MQETHVFNIVNKYINFQEMSSRGDRCVILSMIISCGQGDPQRPQKAESEDRADTGRESPSYVRRNTVEMWSKDLEFGGEMYFSEKI